MTTSSLFTKDFWVAAVERAIKTAAQFTLVSLGASETGPGNLFEANPANILGIAVSGAVVSLLTSITIAGASGNGPSLTPKAEVDVALAPLTQGDGGA